MVTPNSTRPGHVAATACRTIKRTALLVALLIVIVPEARAAEVYLRFKITQPAGDKFHVVVGGFRHRDPWYFPETGTDVSGGVWSQWIDLSKWPWHGRLDRSGGVAEWPSLKLSVTRSDALPPVRGCAFAVQLSDHPGGAKPIISFVESSASNIVAFLVPTPLREHAREFESGSQMAARHHAWAVKATGGKPISLKKFSVITALWGHYDPGLASQEVDALKQLGFNVISGADASVLREAGVQTYSSSFLYEPDPEQADKQWNDVIKNLPTRLLTADGAWTYSHLSHWVISDEVSTVDFRNVAPAKRDKWFRDWLRDSGVADSDLPVPIDQAVYPADAMYAKALNHDAPLKERRLLYYGAKFGQLWSAKQLRHSSELVRSVLPGMQTETLPTDHGFFNAWGPPHIGMSYRLLDLFELGEQQSVDQLSVEDWLGLNHMYGPATTWTGAQSFGYLNAIMRSAIGENEILQRGLITPSDDAYLRLKAYSALAQGAKSFFFWTYGPTYIGTENYWSDLRSEYDGIAKLNRALAKSEDVLYPAKPVPDPVAILYAVSHDIWHTDNPAAFVEKRLLWHALRHDGIQPDFLREEDLRSWVLQRYKVLYITDWCLTRRASAAIDAWVRNGGVVYLSAGAATRDEFYEPYTPPFAREVWPDAAALHLTAEKHTYNERGDLPTIPSMTRATVRLQGKTFDLPVLGCRLTLRSDVPSPFATFADGSPAGAIAAHGQGKVVAVGFMPMLAYGQLAGFKPTTMQEKWPQAPRDLIHIPVSLAKVKPAVHSSVPVVEASLLTGPAGSALILANYTYKPIRNLTIDVTLPAGADRAVSAEGHPVRLKKTPAGVQLELPLETADIVILSNQGDH